MSIKMLSRDDLVARGIRYHPASLCRLISEGKFPRPVKLGGNRNSWPEDAIERWLETKIAEAEASAVDEKVGTSRKTLAQNAAKARAKRRAERDAETA
jgi:hypothetical protein